MVKVVGGSVGLLEHENAFLKWATASPITSDMLGRSEEHCNRSIKCKHHQDTKSFDEAYLKDRKSFLTAFLQLENPFLEEDRSLVHIVSKHVLDKA